MCFIVLKAKGFSSSSSSSHSNIVCCSLLCLCFSNSKFNFGDLLDNFRGHLFFYNLFFNFETLGLDVEGCHGFTSIDIVGTYGFFSGKNKIAPTLQSPMQNVIHPF
jgi:hypothetical protein